MRTLIKIEKELNADLRKQMNVLMPVTAVALHEKGQSRDDIMQCLEAARDTWKECSQSNEVSMMEMLEAETEIEMQVGDGKSWHDCPWMNAKVWNRKMPTEAQLIYIRTQQKKWIPAMVMAMMLIAVKRSTAWEYDALVELMMRVDALRDEYGTQKAAVEQMAEKTGIEMREVEEIWK